MITSIRSVSICHHTKLLQYYWLYSLCVHYIPRLMYFIAGSLYLLILFIYFLCPTPPSPVATTHFFSVSMSLLLTEKTKFFHFVCSFVLFSRLHISEIIWYLFFSISLSIIHYRSIHVAAYGKISFFFNGWVIFHCVYISHLLYPFIYASIDASIAWLL